jgi:hypothetical protein
MNIRNVCLALGWAFVAVGILGFIPNPLVSSEGFFVVNGLHNLVHLATGAAFIFGAALCRDKEALIVTSIGVVYLGVAGLGFVTSGNMLLGMIHINEADRWLHLGLAFAILLPGILLRTSQESVHAKG